MPFPQFSFILGLGFVYALDVSPDGSVVIGAGVNEVIAHSAATGAVLWRMNVPGFRRTLRIHGGVVVIPADGSATVVLDVTTGHQIHTLPAAMETRGICLFEGLVPDVVCSAVILTIIFQHLY